MRQISNNKHLFFHGIWWIKLDRRVLKLAVGYLTMRLVQKKPVWGMAGDSPGTESEVIQGLR